MITGHMTRLTKRTRLTCLLAAKLVLTHINTLTPSNVSVNMRASSNSCTAVGEFIR